MMSIGGLMMKKTILIADDEMSIRDIIKKYLENEGYAAISFDSGEKLLDYYLSNGGDMIILDIMMPGRNGYEICRELRKTSDVPIIIVSAKDEELDLILGLELGSDDYLAKPFSPRELIARVKSLFRRIDKTTKSIDDSIIFQDLTLYFKQRNIEKDHQEILFTKKEYDLLYFLIKNKNNVFNREQLIENIWGYDFIGETRIIDDVIKRIRKKLKECHSNVEITTVWGYGYKVKED